MNIINISSKNPQKMLLYIDKINTKMSTAYAATTGTSQAASDTASELTQLIELVITKIPLWIAAIIVIVLSIFAARIARRMVENKMAEKGIEEEHKEVQILGGRIAYSSVLIMGFTVGLNIAGIDLTTIIAAGAFGIGFALKDLIMNFLAGIMILVSRHFTIGDFIKVGNTLGKVVAIESRVTILQAVDGTKVIVPNADLFKKQVISFTSNPFRRIELIVRVDYRNNLENALKVCMDAVKTTKGILIEPKPAVIVDNFEDKGVSIKVKAWVESRGGWVKIKSRLAKKIKSNFDEYGIKIPWPIKTIANDKDYQFNEKMMEEETPVKEATVEVATSTAAFVQPMVPVPVVEQTSDDEQPPLKPLGEKH